MEIKLNQLEIDALKNLFYSIYFNKRKGEIGIRHGMDRFVSSGLILKKANFETLNKLCQRLGNSGIKILTDK